MISINEFIAYKKRYFKYLCNLISYDEKTVEESYNKLLLQLLNKEFTYMIPADVNRAEDGKDLRHRFVFQYGNQGIPASFFSEPCSVLEMMIALALRCEEDIMSDPDKGDRTGLWFWTMIVSLKLDSMTDEYYDREYVLDCIDIFLKRKYAPNGEGGLFTVDDPDIDMRTIEIWYQMHFYLNYTYE